MGVLITGASGSERASSRWSSSAAGSGLIADDVLEFYRIGPETIEGRAQSFCGIFSRCSRARRAQHPYVSRRGGRLRPSKNLKLIVHLAAAASHALLNVCRTPGYKRFGSTSAQVTIPVAAGRNCGAN